MAGLFRNTALMLETTAVMTSTSRLASMGKEVATAAKVIAAKTAPTAEPMARKVVISASSG